MNFEAFLPKAYPDDVDALLLGCFREFKHPFHHSMQILHPPLSGRRAL